MLNIPGFKKERNVFMLRIITQSALLQDRLSDRNQNVACTIETNCLKKAAGQTSTVVRETGSILWTKNILIKGGRTERLIVFFPSSMDAAWPTASFQHFLFIFQIGGNFDSYLMLLGGGCASVGSGIFCSIPNNHIQSASSSVKCLGRAKAKDLLWKVSEISLSFIIYLAL